jgi:hypothetical protein
MQGQASCPWHERCFFNGLLALAMTAAGLAAPAFTAGDAPKPELTVSIAAPENHGSRSIIINQPDSHFHVVVTNVSDKPQKLWREWCSWGYYDLSFKCINSLGEESVVVKQPREWTKNYPDWQSIPPGESLVIDVYPSRDWKDFPLPAKGKEIKVRLQAVYEIKPDEQTKKEGVWTGKVESQMQEYTIYNWLN